MDTIKNISMPLLAVSAIWPTLNIETVMSYAKPLMQVLLILIRSHRTVEGRKEIWCI